MPDALIACPFGDYTGAHADVLAHMNAEHPADDYAGAAALRAGIDAGISAPDDDDAAQLAAIAACVPNTVAPPIDLTGRGFALTETDTGAQPTTGADVRVQLAIVTRPTGEAFVQISLMSPDAAQLYGGAQVDLADVQNAVMQAMAGAGPLGGF